MRLLIALLLIGCKPSALPSIKSPPIVDLSHANRFIFVGDTGTGKREQYQVAKGMTSFCSSHVCDFGLLLGDNIYEKGVKSVEDKQWQSKFEKPYKDIPFKFYAALGNHDHYGSWQAQVAYTSPKWSMPARYYKIKLESASIYVLDTQVIDQSQADWLDASLQADDSKIVIVAGHHPVYSYGSHGDTKEMKKIILPVLQKHEVDLYLNGHDHDLQVIRRDGMHFITSGAGAKLRSAGRGKYTLYSVSKLGFGYFDFSADTARVALLNKKGQVLWGLVLGQSAPPVTP